MLFTMDPPNAVRRRMEAIFPAPDEECMIEADMRLLREIRTEKDVFPGKTGAAGPECDTVYKEVLPANAF